MHTHYDVLGIRRDAEGEQIRAAYRSLAKIYHPDLNPGDERAEKVFKQICYAYKILSDPIQRDVYDRQLINEDEDWEDEHNISRSSMATASIPRSGSFLGRLTRFVAVGAIALGAPFAASTYISDLRIGLKWIASSLIVSQEYGVTLATAAEMPPGPRLFVAGGQAPVNFSVPLVIALQGSVPADAGILIHGLPYGTSLSAGRSAGNSAWRVSVSELFNISIRPPEDFAGSLDLSIELRLADDTVVDRRPLRVWWVRTPGIGDPALPSGIRADTTPVPTLQQPAAAIAARSDPVPEPKASQVPIGERTQAQPIARIQNSDRTFRDCPFCPEMVPLKGGTFSMGSADDSTEKPIHRVTVKPFALSRFPVTVKEWRNCTACTSQVIGEDDTPVRNLSWDDAQQYVTWLARGTLQKYRLPSEAEWEFAGRARTTTKYPWGDGLVAGMANCSECGGAYNEASPTKVGYFPPNALGFYDMSGSVSQWVSDCWHPTYHGAPNDGSFWDAPNCHQRVLRGGSWLSGAFDLRSSNRNHYDAGVRYPANGLRIARSPMEGQLVSGGN